MEIVLYKVSSVNPFFLYRIIQDDKKNIFFCTSYKEIRGITRGLLGRNVSGCIWSWLTLTRHPQSFMETLSPSPVFYNFLKIFSKSSKVYLTRQNDR